MAKHTFPVLWILLAFGHLSAGNLVLNVTPDTISPGLTSDLTVNCSFTYNNQPNISTIMSLIISKAESHNNQPGSFAEILSINAFTKQINYKGSTNATTSGNIDSYTLDAFLRLSWSSPSQAESGFYRCDANVLDDFGHPVDISTSAEVTSSKPDLDRVIGIVETLEADLEVVKQELNFQIQTNNYQHSTIVALNSTLAAQNSELVDLNSTVVALQQDFEDEIKNKANQVTDLQTELDQQDHELQDLIFTESHSYDGHVYLYAGIEVRNIRQAEYFCNISHGYLAEIEDQSEYQFIKDFINSLSWKTHTLVGATRDDDGDREWILPLSGRPMSYLVWYRGLHPSGDDSCMYLYNNYWSMAGAECDNLGIMSFLCEVSES